MKALTSFSRILTYTDFSKSALSAFKKAVEMAGAAEDAEIVLLHVIPEPDAQFWKTYLYELEDIDDKAKETIDKNLAEAYFPIVPEGMRVRVKMAIGSVGLELLNTIKEEKIDLLILPRPEKASALSLFLHGTRRLVKKATCPILIVPG